MEPREATADDLDALIERWYTLATAMEAYDELNELTYTDVDDVPADGFHLLLDDPAVTIYLVVHDGEPIGYVTLREGHHPSRKYAQYLRIVDLVFDDGHRNNGYGTKVVERVTALAREWGCDRPARLLAGRRPRTAPVRDDELPEERHVLRCCARIRSPQRHRVAVRTRRRPLR